MCQEYYTTKRRKYKQFSETERYKLEGYLEAGLSVKEIAALLGRNQSSIRREIAKGTVELKNTEWIMYKKYCADFAQMQTELRGQNKGAGLKIGNDHELAADIEKLIGKKKYSPYAALAKIAGNGKRYKTKICTKTLYNYIYAGLFLNINSDDLTVKKSRKSAVKRRKASFKNKRAKTIEDRPKEAENREEYGHQEMDLVVGKRGTKEAMLVFTDRKTRQEIIRKIPDKTQDSVKKAIDVLEIEMGDKFAKRFKTVTCDNGSEFLCYEDLEKSVLHEGKRFELYYAHPYSAYERGSNENANKLIRRFIPKGTDIGEYSDEDIARIERWINNYPRKIFGGKTANDMAA